jgi:6-phosphogluconolactonase (cycloisomerase 2 family)
MRKLWLVLVVGALVVGAGQAQARGLYELTPLGCIQNTGGIDCGAGNTTPGLNAANSTAVSPDGTSVYTTSNVSQAVVRFDRNPSSGALTPAGCIQNTGGTDCGALNTTPGLNGANSVAVSPDGTSVYTASYVSGAVVRFDRNPSSGALTPAGCIQNTGGTDCGALNTTPGLGGAFAVAVSPDGSSVYTAGYVSGAVVRFYRNPSSGALVPLDCIQDTGGTACGAANTTPGLNGPTSVTVSPDGKSVYTASRTSGAVVRFDRSPSYGWLTPAGCIQNTGGTDCGAANTTPGLGGAHAVTVSPDGSSVYIASRFSDAVVRFDRSLSSGALTPADCIQNSFGPDCGAGNTAPGLDGASSVAVSPDGTSVYTASYVSGAVVRFDRELPPVCVGSASSAAPGTQQLVTLACKDPNGDPMTLAIVDPPSHGTLGTINQNARTVSYTPAAGFSGLDSFSYKAISDGRPSAVATAIVQVQAMQGPAGIPGPSGTNGQPGLNGLNSPLVALLGNDSFVARAGRGATFRYAATEPGDAKLVIRKGGKTVATLAAKLAKAGRGTLTWNGKVKKGRKNVAAARGNYTVAFSFTARGRTATDTAKLKLTK